MFVKFCWVEGLAKGTRVRYGIALQQYLEFCRAHRMVDEEGYAPFPGEEVLMWFAGWKKWTKGCQPDTVIGTLTGLASELVRMGRTNPTVDSLGVPLPQLKWFLRGMKRKYSKKKKRRDALTIDKLKLIIEHIRNRDDISDLDKATLIGALASGTYMMLRVGEQVCTTQKKFDPEANPSLGDVTFDVGNIKVQEPSFAGYNVKESKTDYFRQGCTLRCAANGTSTCPVDALATMVRLRLARGARPTDPLFVMENGAFLTRHRLQAEMKNSLTAVGLVAGHYTSHSMRIGGATSLAACEEMDADRIRVLGRWSSDCFLRYLRQTNTMLKSCSRMLGAMGDVDFQTLGRKAFNPATAE